jgi:hypothetical protein
MSEPIQSTAMNPTLRAGMEDYYAKLKQDIANPDLDADARQHLNQSIQAYERYAPQNGLSVSSVNTPISSVPTMLDKYLTLANPAFSQ